MEEEMGEAMRAYGFILLKGPEGIPHFHWRYPGESGPSSPGQRCGPPNGIPRKTFSSSGRVHHDLKN